MIRELQHSIWRGWLTHASQRKLRSLRTQGLPLVQRHIEQLRGTRDREVIQKLAELRKSTIATRRQQEKEEKQQRALGIAAASLPLIARPTERQVAFETLALGCVLMNRTLGVWPHPNQILASLALAEGCIIQLDTGEGKTFVGALRVLLDYVFGLRSTVVVPNAYLAWRDSTQLKDFYEAGGLRCGCADGEMGLERNPGAYLLEVCYVSLERLMFDYVSRVSCHSVEDWVDFQLESVVIDEIDAILLDSGSFAHSVALPLDATVFREADSVAQEMVPGDHFEKPVTITSKGLLWLDRIVSQFPSLVRLVAPLYHFHVRCALCAHHHLKLDVDYLLVGNRIVAVDETTGRPVPNRSFGIGYHQALEQRHGVPLSSARDFIYSVQPTSVLAEARHICGMSGSTAAERVTFRKVFGLPVLVVPPNRPTQRRLLPMRLFGSRKSQLGAAAQQAADYSVAGRPVLVCTQTIQDSEEIVRALRGLGRAAKLINAKNAFEEAGVMRFAGDAGTITVAARMAGRGVDIVVDDAGTRSGGLAVIGIGHFIFRRLDEQLAGRTGRQGAGGDVQFFVSMDDETWQHVPKRLRGFIASIEGELPNVPFNLPHAIRTQQARQRDLALFGLWSRVQRDEILSAARLEYEQLRREILTLASTEPIVRQEIKNLLQIAANDPKHWVWTTSGLDTGQPGEYLTVAEAALHEVYQERKVAAGPAGDVRERAILRTALDFQWALLYKDWGRHCSLSNDFRVGLFHDYRFLAERLSFLRSEFAEHAVWYLLAIDSDKILESCFFWRGTMIPVNYRQENESPPETDEAGAAATGTATTTVAAGGGEAGSLLEEGVVPSSENQAPKADPFGGVPVPARQRIAESPHAPSPPLAKDALPSKPPNPAGMDNHSARSQLDLRNRRLLRWSAVGSAAVSIVLGTIGTYFLVRISPENAPWLTPTQISSAASLLKGLLAILGAPLASSTVVFSVCVLSAILLERLTGRGRLFLPVCVLGVVAACRQWSDLPAAAGWSAVALVIAAILWRNGWRFQDTVSAVVVLTVLPAALATERSMALLLVALAVTVAIVAISAFSRFDLGMAGGWEESDGSVNFARRRYIVFCIDDGWPLLAGWVWASLALGNWRLLRVELHPTTTFYLWLGGFIAGTLWIGLRRSRVRFVPESYRREAWQVNGTLERGGQVAPAESIARATRRRTVVSWLLVGTSIALGGFLTSSQPAAIWWLLSFMLGAFAFARVVQVFVTRYFALREPDFDSALLPPGERTGVWQTLNRLVRHNGGWSFWLTALLLFLIGMLQSFLQLLSRTTL